MSLDDFDGDLARALSVDVPALRRVGITVPKWTGRRIRFWRWLGRDLRAQRLLLAHIDASEQVRR